MVRDCVQWQRRAPSLRATKLPLSPLVHRHLERSSQSLLKAPVVGAGRRRWARSIHRRVSPASITAATATTLPLHAGLGGSGGQRRMRSPPLSSRRRVAAAPPRCLRLRSRHALPGFRLITSRRAPITPQPRTTSALNTDDYHLSPSVLLMGCGCSTPRLTSLQPPLEVVVLSDGSCADAAFLSLLLRPHWLSSSSLLQRRLPHRLARSLPPLHVSAHPLPRNTPPSIARTRTPSPVSPLPPSIPLSTLSPFTSLRRAPQVCPNPSPSVSPVPSLSPSPPQLLSFLLPTTTSSPPSPSPSSSSSSCPYTLRFHLCPDYLPSSRRRTSSLLRHPPPIPTHLRRHSRSPPPPPPPHPLYTSHPLDGCLVFLHTSNASTAGSALVGDCGRC